MRLRPSLLLAALLAGGLPGLAADAPAHWSEHCAKCHGEGGKGDTKMGRKLGITDLTDPAVQAKFTDEAALKAMREGVKDKDGKLSMKPVEGLAEADLKALVGHVRSLRK